MMSTTAPTKATAHSIIVLRFPNLSFDILSRPGTGGTRSRTKTRTAIKAIVNGRAIVAFYHHSPDMLSPKYPRTEPSGHAMPGAHLRIEGPGRGPWN